MKTITKTYCRFYSPDHFHKKNRSYEAVVGNGIVETPSYDQRCKTKVSGGCSPVAVISAERLVEPFSGTDEAAKIATASPGTESALLRSALEPVMGDELMVEIGGLGESLDSFAEAMNASQRNIDQLVDASVRDERRRITNEFRMDSIGSSCCEASAGENPRENDGNSDVSNSLFNSSFDVSMNASLERIWG